MFTTKTIILKMYIFALVYKKMGAKVALQRKSLLVELKV